MKLLFISLLVLLATVALAGLALREPGHVLFVYGDVSVETSLVLFTVGLVVLFIVLYLFLRLLLGAWGLPRRLGAARRHRRLARARKGLARGQLELARAQWDKAEKHSLKGIRYSDTPLLAYLTAAQAAQMQGARARRDEYLRKAHEQAPEEDQAIGLTRAELQLADDQTEQALASLHLLRQRAPKNGYAMKLLARLYYRMGDWQRLWELLPELRRADIFNPREFGRLERAAAQGLMARAGRARDLKALQAVWSELPERARERESLLTVYARELRRLDRQTDAERLIRAFLEKQWSEALIYDYGLIDVSDPKLQLARCEAWSLNHKRSARLHLTLGRLYRRAQLWGKAKHNLESSLGIEPLAEAYLELALLHEQLGEDSAAQDCYRKGLELAVDGPPTAVPGLRLPLTGAEPASIPPPEKTQLASA